MRRRPRPNEAGGMGHFFYPRYFAGLTAAAALLLATSHWHRSHSALVSFAVCGMLHASVTAMTLRARYALGRKLLFIGVAAALSGLSFAVSLYGGRLLGLSAPLGYLVIAAGVGAGAYALLIRRLFIADLSLRALLLIPLAGALAVVAVFLSGLYARNIDVLALAWWFAFSAGLWCEDRRHALTVSRSGESIHARNS
jgi:hypothetical protein